VQALLSTRVRTCAYDRAGSGWSEPGPTPRTLRQEVFELHALLEKAAVPGPYILVGQSLGGLLVRLYTGQYGSNVLGVVLVDPTHESSVLYRLKEGRWVRLRELATGRAIPEPRRGDGSDRQEGPEDDYLAEEFQQIHLARQKNPQPFGNRPLIVLAAGRRPAPPGVSEEVWARLKVEKDEQVRDQASLSQNSKFQLDPSSGHNLHLENPELVARAIEEVMAAAVKGARLAAGEP
jgi:pimeloyl-ACP methyl ester carboxylesterase